ncbi:4Fe-4S dicluster domain-containing protein [Sporomusa sp.]|uniref:4Fe-4S dicluster domain-containing protein n=1 Tax=Sporomusa sp. TaxID=2078658 RepID=UPI002C822187|nr:4Fe-4S dicluster domain-containing protein [Sporomusa sp.]HWR41794.1 4Fe-4S dicluster domain-containing protein [Sporomusa sp.]
MAEKMMALYDSSKCTGCGACSVACKQWNSLPGEKTSLVNSYQTQNVHSSATWTFMSYQETYENKRNNWFFRKNQCMHCTDAACEKACNYKAISHNEQGFVVIDHTKCIGCGYCTTNCTFHIPRVDAKLEKSTKCTGCSDRVEQGLSPACVKVCQPQALIFGGKQAIVKQARERVQQLRASYPRANFYGDAELGGLNYACVLLREPQFYNLPANPSVPLSLTIWKDWVLPLGGLGIAGALAMVGIGTFMNYRGGAGKGHHTDEGKGGDVHD